jgi:hypothetical protein
MTDSPAKGNFRRIQAVDDWATSVVFLILIIAPLILSALNVGRDETIMKNGEYRMPAPHPGLPRSPGALLAFPWQWEEYWRDVFPYRGRLIHLHADVRYKKLRANSQNILFMEDGYVFNQNEIDFYRGRFPEPMMRWIALWSWCGVSGPTFCSMALPITLCWLLAGSVF